MTTPATAAPEHPSFTHPCVRCGTPIPLEDGMCDRCNPLGLKQPAASQAHGTVFIGIVIAVVGLAILGRMALSGIGPFTGEVTRVEAASSLLHVTLTVHNDGSRAGSATCRVFDPAQTGIGPEAAFLTTPEVPAGSSISFAGDVTTLGSTVKTLGVDCSGS